ncbi:SDR family NAD(P)-dependent oxidoreductase [Aquabacter sp. P-9]|uniref:SDR family NAD(P)-dependent oxidoreductase n=1 Tax=Aquabacter sediminis TaxID=3029197 RepID=UPI00237ED559|nr:SDR family oxidoreductase [Aquabacter sp. P-9]MDE1570429.1 SDR family oxidoreductase [Aquabacter sp. P-9]
MTAPSSSPLPAGIHVVTGGASGIGAACARALAAAGARVAVADRDLERAQAVAQEIGGRAFSLDVAHEDDVERCAAAIEAEYGPVDVLVNSAGILQVPLRPHDLPMEAWDAVINIDQRGTYLGCRAFARSMLKRRAGSIINIASITGSRSVPMHAYAPAKAAVIAISRCLAAEWGPAGVRVNSISPGYTLTPALQAAIDKGERDVSNLAGNAALNRLVLPEEVADAVIFLAGRTSSAITGIDLPVDCGWLVATTWHTYGGTRLPA